MDNPAAFPSERQKPMPGGGAYRDDVPGMTLRDYFAGQALHYVCTVNQEYLQAHPSTSYPFHAAIAKDAYEIADAMLAERSRVPA